MLHIAKAQLEDSGPYMCQVLYYILYCTVPYYTQLNTDPMKSKMGVLNVIIKPDITDVTGPRAVQEGGNVRCQHLKIDNRYLWFILLNSDIYVTQSMCDCFECFVTSFHISMVDSYFCSVKIGPSESV